VTVTNKETYKDRFKDGSNQRMGYRIMQQRASTTSSKSKIATFESTMSSDDNENEFGNDGAGEETTSKNRRAGRSPTGRPRPKDRSRSPAPGGASSDDGGGEDIGGSAHRSPTRRARHIPVNPARGVSSNGDAGSSNPARDRSQRGHSPKRSELLDSSQSRDKAPISPRRRVESDEDGEGTKTATRSPRRVQKSLDSSRGRSPGKTSSSQRPEGTSQRGKRSVSPKKLEGGADGVVSDQAHVLRSNNNSGRIKSPKKMAGRGSPKKKLPAQRKRTKEATPATADGIEPPSMEFHASSPKPMHDESEQGSEYSGAGASLSPRYVSPKGNSTHLQLDFAKMQGGADMPIFSLLDENSLVDGESDDDAQQKQPKDKNHHVLRKMNNSQGPHPSSPTPTKPEGVKFVPWGHKNTEDDEEDDEYDNNHRPKSPKSPLTIGNAMKALKYNKPLGVSKAMEKMSAGFQQRLGLADRHQPMQDHDDDFATLL